MKVRVRAGSRAVLECGAEGDEPIRFHTSVIIYIIIVTIIIVTIAIVTIAIVTIAIVTIAILKMQYLI